MTGADIPPGWDDIVMAFKLGHLEGQMDRVSPAAGGGGGRRGGLNPKDGPVHSSEGGDFEAFQKRAREKLAREKLAASDGKG